MIDYRKLMQTARRKERFYLIDFLRYRLQKRQAIYTELKHIYTEDGLAIKKDIEKQKTKRVSFKEFLEINGKTIVLN